MVQKVKIVLLGQENIGKTSLVSRFVNGVLPQEPETTIGVAFKTQRLFHGSKELDLNIWDTAGQERFSHFLPLYLHHAKVALICFELPYLVTIEKYVDIVRKADPKILIILVATKIDLYGVPLGSKYDLTHPSVEVYAEEQNLKLKYTSAKTGQGINEVFDDAIETLEKNGALWEIEFHPVIELKENEEKPKNTIGCC